MTTPTPDEVEARRKALQMEIEAIRRERAALEAADRILAEEEEWIANIGKSSPADAGEAIVKEIGK